MTRDEMVNDLINWHIDNIFEAGTAFWIGDVLRSGASFNPYDNRTNEEIETEYKEIFQRNRLETE